MSVLNRKNKSKIFLGVLFLALGLVFFVSLKNFSSTNGPHLNLDWDIKKQNGNIPYNSLVPYDLNNRTFDKEPLILIHGTVSDFQSYCGWKCILDQFKEKGILDKYEVYIFKYPSNSHSWENIKQDLSEALSELTDLYEKYEGENKREIKFNFLVSSLGGNVLCDTLSLMDSTSTTNTTKFSKRINKIISLGTPFWGVPVMEKDLKSNNSSSINSVTEKILLTGTDFLFPVLSEELHWRLSESSEKDNKLENPSCGFVKEKFINYGAYMDSPITQKEKPEKEEVKDWFYKTVKSEDIRHVWNAFVHYKVGYEKRKELGQAYLLKFNDGLVPIFSSLWLDPDQEKFQKESFLDEKNLRKIHMIKPRARIFKGLDHTDLTHSCDRNGKLVFEDVLNDEKKATLTDFIIEDLS